VLQSRDSHAADHAKEKCTNQHGRYPALRRKERQEEESKPEKEAGNRQKIVFFTIASATRLLLIRWRDDAQATAQGSGDESHHKEAEGRS